MRDSIQRSHRWGNSNLAPEPKREAMYLAQLRYWYNGYSVKAELFPDEDHLRPSESGYSDEAISEFQQGDWEYVTLRVTVKDDEGRVGVAWSYGHEYGPIEAKFSNPIANPDAYPLFDKVLDAIEETRA